MYISEKFEQEVKRVGYGLKNGYSLLEIYDILENKYFQVGRHILGEYIKREKEKGNIELFNEFMKTCFIKNCNPKKI